MKATNLDHEREMGEIRLLLEELCCDLCRFEHMSRDGIAPESIQVDREVDVGFPDAFADIRVRPLGSQSYFIEVKYGYSDERLISQLRRKFSQKTPLTEGVSRVILLTDLAGRLNWPSLEREVAESLFPGLELEVWDEARFVDLIRKHCGLSISSLSRDNLLDVREAVDKAKGFYAFGGDSLEKFANDPLKSQLLWHFAYWNLRELAKTSSVRELLSPDLYRGVAVVMGDLCSFSSYVRDTSDERIIRQQLTAFYSRTRYQIINLGGMLYEFAGDSVIGLFGIPHKRPGYLADALEAAKRLVSIGKSVSNEWQRQIDRVQASGGLHVGVALGDLQIVSLRPFSRTHVGGIGDTINLAARLMTAAGPSELMVSNAFFNEMGVDRSNYFEEVPPLEAKNMGRIKAWKYRF